MRIIQPKWRFLNDKPTQQQILTTLEYATRTCYRSHDKMNDSSAEQLISRCIAQGHESVLEHVSLSLLLTVDRAVSHELVRHRIASYSQESQRYVAYRGENIDIVEPVWIKTALGIERNLWEQSAQRAVDTYRELLARGIAAQDARSVLPNCTATRIAMTANIREWRHVLRLRTSPAAHPDMRRAMGMVLANLQTNYPVLFGDLPKGKVDITCKK